MKLINYVKTSNCGTFGGDGLITLDETGTICKGLQPGLYIYCCCTKCHDTKGWSNDIL